MCCCSAAAITSSRCVDDDTRTPVARAEKAQHSMRAREKQGAVPRRAAADLFVEHGAHARQLQPPHVLLHHRPLVHDAGPGAGGALGKAVQRHNDRHVVEHFQAVLRQLLAAGGLAAGEAPTLLWVQRTNCRPAARPRRVHRDVATPGQRA